MNRLQGRTSPSSQNPTASSSISTPPPPSSGARPREQQSLPQLSQRSIYFRSTAAHPLLQEVLLKMSRLQNLAAHAPHIRPMTSATSAYISFIIEHGTAATQNAENIYIEIQEKNNCYLHVQEKIDDKNKRAPGEHKEALKKEAKALYKELTALIKDYVRAQRQNRVLAQHIDNDSREIAEALFNDGVLSPELYCAISNTTPGISPTPEQLLPPYSLIERGKQIEQRIIQEQQSREPDTDEEPLIPPPPTFHITRL